MYFTLLLFCILLQRAPARTIRHTPYTRVATYLSSYYKNTTGTFIDIGCNNGQSSNTYILEGMGWKGFCVTRNPRTRTNAITYRGSICLPGMKETDVVFKVKTIRNGDVVRIYDEEVEEENKFAEEETFMGHIPCYDLHKLRELHTFVNVTYMTIDTRGDELELFSAYRPFDWVKWIEVKCHTTLVCLELLQVLIKDGFYMEQFIPESASGGSLLVKHK